ncbi:MAG TPA: DUF3563 family protein [Casimicrobiaceae bacterium]|nr:DUF3563 family protein [Casimicrobiaceae bacterium]
MSSYDTPNAAEMYFNQSIFGHLHAAIAGVPPMPQKRKHAPASGASVAGAAAPRRPLLERLDAWFWHQMQRDREAYLAGSADVFELERRIDAIERGVVTRLD